MKRFLLLLPFILLTNILNAKTDDPLVRMTKICKIQDAEGSKKYKTDHIGFSFENEHHKKRITILLYGKEVISDLSIEFVKVDENGLFQYRITSKDENTDPFISEVLTKRPFEELADEVYAKDCIYLKFRDADDKDLRTEEYIF